MQFLTCAHAKSLATSSSESFVEDKGTSTYLQSLSLFSLHYIPFHDVRLSFHFTQSQSFVSIFTHPLQIALRCNIIFDGWSPIIWKLNDRPGRLQEPDTYGVSLLGSIHIPPLVTFYLTPCPHSEHMNASPLPTLFSFLDQRRRKA